MVSSMGINYVKQGPSDLFTIYGRHFVVVKRCPLFKQCDVRTCGNGPSVNGEMTIHGKIRS